MKTLENIVTSCILLFGCLSFSSVYGVLIVNDTFDYGGDNTLVPSPWQDATSNIEYDGDKTATWTGDSDYMLSGAGGSMFARASASGSYRGAQLNLSALTGTFWTSVLVEETTADSSTSGPIVAFDTGPGYAIAEFDGFAFGINGDGNLMTAPNSSSGTSAVGGPVALPTGFGLYVAKITVNGGGADDAIDLWAFDSGDSFGQTELSLGTAIYSSSTVQYGDSIGAVWLGGRIDGGVRGDGYFDNLRISDLSGDEGLQEVLSGTVIPEPSSVLLLSLGLTLAVGGGYRRKC